MCYLTRQYLFVCSLYLSKIIMEGNRLHCKKPIDVGNPFVDSWLQAWKYYLVHPTMRSHCFIVSLFYQRQHEVEISPKIQFKNFITLSSRLLTVLSWEIRTFSHFKESFDSQKININAFHKLRWRGNVLFIRRNIVYLAFSCMHFVTWGKSWDQNVWWKSNIWGS